MAVPGGQTWFRRIRGRENFGGAKIEGGEEDNPGRVDKENIRKMCSEFYAIVGYQRAPVKSPRVLQDFGSASANTSDKESASINIDRPRTPSLSEGALFGEK